MAISPKKEWYNIQLRISQIYLITCCQDAPSSPDVSRITVDPPPLTLSSHEVAIVNCSVRIVLENLTVSVTADVSAAPLYKK